MKLVQPSDDCHKDKPLRMGYLLRMYPRFTQTFIVNEMLELERQGTDISILSLRLPNEGLFHESVSRVKARADYVPETSQGRRFKTVRRQWQLLRKSPGAYRRAVGMLARYDRSNWYQLAQAAHVVAWARKKKIDHVHVHFGTDEATVAMLASLLGGPSYSLTLHAFDIFRDNVNRRLLAEKINHSRFTITVSDYNRRFMVEHLPGVDAEKIRVNYNGLDMGQFTLGEVPREDLSIFSVGRLIEKKGFIHLIRAVARLRESGLPVTCRIAGEGREMKNLQAEIKRTGVTGHVQLLGRVRQTEVQGMMQRAQCFALPCVHAADGNVDALPTVLLESLAMGCPSVSTRVSGVPEIIEDRVSGLLVEPEDDQTLSVAIREILVNRALAAKLSRGGRDRAERVFDIRKNVSVMRDWLVNAQRNGRSCGRSADQVAAGTPETADALVPVLAEAS